MSSIRRVYYRADTAAPPTPAGLTGTAQSPTEIRLTCLPVDDAPAGSGEVQSGLRGYRWYCGLNAGSVTSEIVLTGNPAVTHAGLTPGTLYHYAVAAVDRAGNVSAKSPVVSVRTTTEVVLPPPTLSLAISPARIAAGQSATITWSTTNATAVTASGSWSGAKALSGSQVVRPAASSVYSLTATGAGSTSSSVALVVDEVDVDPPGPSDGLFKFAELPEIAFVEGYADNEFLGQFCLDPSNRPQPGDVFESDEDQPYWQRGLGARPRKPDGTAWAPAINRRVTVDGTLPAGVTWAADTGLLTYNGRMLADSEKLSATGGVGAEASLRLRLDYEGGTLYSDTFRLRILRPTHVYATGAAAKVAAKWGASLVQPAAVEFTTTELGPATRTGGTTEDAPIVVLMPDEEYVAQVCIDLDARAPVNNSGAPLTPAPTFSSISSAPVAVMTFDAPHGLVNSETVSTSDQGTFAYVANTYVLTNMGGGFAYPAMETLNVDEVSLRVISQTECEIYASRATRATDGTLNKAEVPLDTSGLAAYAQGPNGPGRYKQQYLKTIGINSAGTFKYVFGTPFTRNRIKHRFKLSFTFGQPPTTTSTRVLSYWRNLDLYGPIDVTATCKTSTTDQFRLPEILVYSSHSIYGVHDRDDWTSRASDGWASDGGDGSTLEPHPAGYSGNASVRTGLPLRSDERQLDYHWSLEITNWMGAAGTKHPFYLHGRPNGHFYTSNIWFHGNPDSIVLKSTRYHVRHRNNHFWSHRSVYDPVKRDQGQSAPTKYINFNQNADGAVYNCKFVTWRNAPYEYGGNNYGYTRIPEVIWLDGRRTIWGGNDGPAFPDLHLRDYVADPRPLQMVFGASGIKNTPGVLIPGLAFYMQPADRTTYAATGAAVAMSPAQTLASLDDTEVGIYATQPDASRDGWLVSIAPSELSAGLYRCWIGSTAKPTATFKNAQIAYIDIYKDAQYIAATGCLPWPDDAREGNYGQDKYVPDSSGMSAYYRLAGVNDDGTLTEWAYDQDNPYTDKAFITHCEWVWLRGEGEDRGNQHGPIVCEGTVPASALGQFSKANVYGAVPANWHHAACVFVANATLRGWEMADLTEFDAGQYKRNFQWKAAGPGAKQCTTDAGLALANNDTINLMLPGYEMYYGADIDNLRATLPDIPYRSVTGRPGALPHEGIDGLNVYEHDGTPVITNPTASLPSWWKI